MEKFGDPFILCIICALLLGHAYNYHGIGSDFLLMIAALVLFFMTFYLMLDGQVLDGRTIIWFICNFVLCFVLVELQTLAGALVVGFSWAGCFVWFAFKNRKRVQKAISYPRVAAGAVSSASEAPGTDNTLVKAPLRF